jgi:hypothetical protein
MIEVTHLCPGRPFWRLPMSRRVLCAASLPWLLLAGRAMSQAPTNQQEALALLAKIEGQATFVADGAAKTVIGIDI